MADNQQKQADTPKPKRWDPAIVLSLIAISISLLGTIIALIETNLLSQQQRMMADQMAASSWPYIEKNFSSTWRNDSLVEWRFSFENEGSGPAIIGDIRYLIGDQEVEYQDLERAMREYWPEQNLDVRLQTGFDNSVLAAGDKLDFLQVDWVPNKETFQILATIDQYVVPVFCYCSIHGACWLSENSERPKRNESCESEVEL